MGRKNKQQPPLPWESPTIDIKAAGNYSRTYKAFIECPAVHKLSPAARWLYECMKTYSAGKSTFHFTVDEAEKSGNKRGSFRRLVKQLIEGGFIRIKDSGKDRRAATVYEFVNLWKA